MKETDFLFFYGNFNEDIKQKNRWEINQEYYLCKQEEQSSISRHDMSLIGFPPG